jgi:cobalamin biosynthesis Mg chelatase CobN
MWSYRKARRRELDLEGALRGRRSEPRDEYVRSLSSRLRNERPAQRTAWSRLAFAASISALILGMFASFGGFEYAASGASSTYHVVKQAVSSNHKVSLSVKKSSAAKQYGPTTHTQPPAGNVAGTTASGSLGASASSGNLPFTGLSLVATVALALALMLAGFALRRREQRN